MSGHTDHVAAAAVHLLDGISGQELAARAARISEGYRDHLPSHRLIADATDAAIYSVMRMPATAAATERALGALLERLPDFAPAHILDAGAGPGTASLVAADVWPGAELALLDAHAGLLELAQKLLDEAGHTARVERTDLVQASGALGSADLVIASYALTELDDSGYMHVAENLWRSAATALVVIEPGRPRDHSRLMDFRAWAIGQGAHVAAPCPHAKACPLVGADWCHFSVRLPRSRAHRLLKSGTLGYEDEKFSYLVLVRGEVALAAPEARVLAQPDAKKHEIRLKLCEPDGQQAWRGLSRRDPHFGQIRRLKWGDTLALEDERAQDRG